MLDVDKAFQITKVIAAFSATSSTRFFESPTTPFPKNAIR